MKCIICHGDDIREATVNEEITRGNDVIFVSVVALKCAQCGERYFDQKTVRYLEKVRKEVRSNTSLDLKEIGRVLQYEDMAKAA
jgi:YgiT-type zinc finger domain-containing protein